MENNFHFRKNPASPCRMFAKMFLRRASTLLMIFSSAAVAGSAAYAGSAASLSYDAAAQPRREQIRGILQDENGEPLPGVVVSLKGSPAVVAVTGSNGEFTLNADDLRGTLVLSCIGYVTQEVPVDGRNYITAAMEPDQTILEEVVVVGFGSQKKTNLTGAVGVVDSRSLETRPVQNVYQALQGVTPGLNLTVNSMGGQLDNTMDINIRGMGSIGEGSGAWPLILIDGVEGNMNILDPNDIESISVLKDLAASSIYGSRAAFGVILVTTKSGAKGKPRVSYTNNFRFSTMMNTPKSLDSYRFALYFNAAGLNSGSGAVFNEETLQRIQDYQAGLIDYGTVANGNTWYQDAGSNANTDWYKELYKDWTPAQEHSLGVAGGTDNVRYAVNSNILTQKGLLRIGSDSFKRYGLNGKVDIDINKYVTMSYSTRWTREDYQGPNYLVPIYFYNLVRKWPTKPLYDPNGYPHEGSSIQELEDGGDRITQTDYFYQTVKVVVEPVRKWKIHLEGSYNITNYNVHAEVLPVYAYHVDGTPYAFGIGFDPIGAAKASEDTQKDNFMSVNIYSDYEFSLDRHNFKVLAGMNADQMQTRNTSATVSGLISPLVPTLDTGSELEAISGGYDHWSSAGFFGRLNYNYDERYLFEANLRYDGASRFVGSRQWALFPSFSAGWNIAREPFFNVRQIGTLKPRISWGQLGNMNTVDWHPFFQSMPISTGTGNWLIDGERTNVATMPGIVSDNMTWERIESWNFGLDWEAFNSRLTGSFDYFIRTTKDMVGPAPELPDVLGTSVPLVNNADMRSVGFELEIGWRDRIGDFRYGAKLVLSDARQKILSYPNESKVLSNWYSGMEVGEIWGYQTVGIAKSQAEMDAHIANVDQGQLGTGWTAGDIMYADLDGNGRLDYGAYTADDHGDLVKLGNDTPRFNYGISLDAEWKGIDLRIFIQGVGKRDFMPNSTYFWGAYGNTATSIGFEEHWDFFRPEGDPLGANLDAYYPRPLFLNYKNQQTQSRYIQNAAYMRLKNVQIGYTIPPKITRRAGISSLRVYVSGENLLTFTKLASMFDPEAIRGAYGYDGRIYPLSTTLSFGVNLNF